MRVSAFVKSFLNAGLSIRGLCIAPKHPYGLNPAADVAKLIMDLALPTPALVVDAGANCGQFTLAFHEFFKDSSFLCAEPHPTTFLNLCGNTRHLHAKCVQVALSDCVGSIRLLSYEGEGRSLMNSICSAGTFAALHDLAPAEMVEVPMTTLTQLLAVHGWDSADVLKLDVEGAEESVLVGADKLLVAGRIGLIAVEWSMRISESGKPVSNLVSLQRSLEAYDYVLAASSVDWSKASPVYVNNNAYFIHASRLMP